MSTFDPFDRATYAGPSKFAPRPPASEPYAHSVPADDALLREVASADASFEAQIDACRAQGQLQGTMLLAFLETLETRLTHEEALALAEQVWCIE